ncbi:MAG: 4Fe-4S binding protein [Bacteroidales bacterium]|nr:4Fe-4S binding protein [Bacteroidales bacterium]
MRSLHKLKLPFSVFAFIVIMLSIVQWKVERPMILLERFIPGGGWIEIPFIAFYGALIAYKMQDPAKVQKWRIIAWTIFSFFFFSQLIIGLLGYSKFLMTGKLHLPVPMMIVAGPVYREQISFMTILFLSTIVLTGPAWCSQLCYFGAIDGLLAKGKTSKQPVRQKWRIKSIILLLVIFVALLLKWIKVPTLYAACIAGGFGIIGLSLILFISRKTGKMVHCTAYCPIGTIVNFLRFINPFRMYIDENCNVCMKCSAFCKYDALNLNDIQKSKPGLTCTLCGDCVASCHSKSIRYKFFGVSPQTARRLYLFLVISFHAVFLALARI